jgi:hypothetical protein
MNNTKKESTRRMKEGASETFTNLFSEWIESKASPID